MVPRGGHPADGPQGTPRQLRAEPEETAAQAADAGACPSHPRNQSLRAVRPCRALPETKGEENDLGGSVRLCFFWIQYLLVGDWSEKLQSRSGGGSEFAPPASISVFHGSLAVPQYGANKSVQT